MSETQPVRGTTRRRRSPRLAEAGGGTTLADQVIATIRTEVGSGLFPVGSRLPIEARLCERYGVSRTVLREAVAVLRAEGVLDARQGSGVYVVSREGHRGASGISIDASRVTSVIEALEIRAAVEVEAAGLAAQRRSPAQEEAIAAAARAFATAGEYGTASTRADLAFHQAIARATNNEMFVNFLTGLGEKVIPRAALGNRVPEVFTTDYLALIDKEHMAIVEAIQAGDSEAARAAMRAHLSTSLQRYRALLRGKS